jgi:hypothetical protein
MLSLQALLEAKDKDLNWNPVRWLKWNSDRALYCPLAGIECVYKNHGKEDIDCGCVTGVAKPAKWWHRGLPKDKLRNCTPDQYEALVNDLGPIGVTWLELQDLETAMKWVFDWNPHKPFKDFVPTNRGIVSLKSLLKTNLSARVIIGFKELK